MSERVLLAIALCVILVALLSRSLRGSGVSETATLHLVADAHGNEALVLDAVVGRTRRALFLLDTAYAGPPVLSTSYLALAPRVAPGLRSVEGRYRSAIARHVSNDARHQAVRSFLSEGHVRAFTSGCTMRLLGIGDVQESQADMFLAPALRLLGSDGDVQFARDGELDADVFVTHDLPGSVHILTSDYLVHNAPALIRPSEGALELRMSKGRQLALRPSFTFHRAVLYGGAFVVPMRVGGVGLRVVVDTGAASALSLSAGVIDRLGRCRRPSEPRTITQRGVNGELVCSDLYRTDIEFGGRRFDDIEIFANSHVVEGADGYAGLGFWRCFDLWIAAHEIGFRPSGLPPKASELSSPGACGGADGSESPPCLKG